MPNDGRILAGEWKELNIERAFRCRIHPGVFEYPGELRALGGDLPFGYCFRNQQVKKGVVCRRNRASQARLARLRALPVREMMRLLKQVVVVRHRSRPRRFLEHL